MNKQLSEYIKKARLQGISDEQIKHNLIQSGWQQNIVNIEFNYKKADSSAEETFLNNNKLDKPFRKFSWKIIIIISIIIIVLGCVAYGAFQYFKSGEKPQGINAQQHDNDIESKKQANNTDNSINIIQEQKNGQLEYLFDVFFNKYDVVDEKTPNSTTGYTQILMPSIFNYNSISAITKIDAKNDCDECQATIPVLSIEMKLPAGAEIASELLDYQENLLTDTYKLMPCIACTSGGCIECSDYPNADEFYPENVLITDDISNFDNYILYRVYLPLIRYNPATKQTYTVNEAQIKVISKQSSNLIINDFRTNKDRYNIGESIKVNMQLENLGLSSIEDFYIEIKYRNDMDVVTDAYRSEKFSIGANEKKDLSIDLDNSLDQGSNIVVVEVKDKNDETLATTNQWIYTDSGEITDFDFPEQIVKGESFTMSLTYQNKMPKEVEAVAKIKFYEDVVNPIGEVSSESFNVPANSEKTIEISSSGYPFLNQDLGTYKISPWVYMGEYKYNYNMISDSVELISK